MEWTKPYHGISHLVDIPKEYRISMNTYTTISYVYMVHKGTYMSPDPHPFTAIKEFTGTVDDCRKEAEKWARKLA